MAGSSWRAGSAALVLSVAPGAAARVSGKSGLGRFSLPDTVERAAGGSWETAGFAGAANQIIIDYKGGIGSFSLAYFDVV